MSNVMFVRIRWFVLGALSSFGMVAYVANHLRRVRTSITPANLAKGAAIVLADALDATARRVSSHDQLD
jgi:hypothetical protein